MRAFFIALAAVMALSTAAVAQTVTPLVSVDWVKDNLDNDEVFILDVRGKLAGASKQDFLEAHIPGAVWTDYLTGGWRMKNGDGVIAQLPSVPQLEALIGDLGISNDHHVVIVPAGGKAIDVATATRVYWTFKMLGHDAVSILDGGMAAYTAARDTATGKPLNPLESGEAEVFPDIFTAELREDMLVTKLDVKAAAEAGDVIVDNRPNDQFLGINKHGAAKRYGTIPGARNLPEKWLTENGGGSFRDRATIEKLYAVAGVPVAGKQISFCNTGHWASLGWFVSSEILGNTEAKMYDGSMVEWSADKELDIQSAVERPQS